MSKMLVRSAAVGLLLAALPLTAQAAGELDLVGLGFHAERKIVDKIINGLKFMA